MELVEYLEAIREARLTLTKPELGPDSYARKFAEEALQHTGSEMPTQRVLALADLWTLIAAEHLQSMATLIRSGTYTFGLFPLARSVIEHSTATYWVLDNDTTNERRCARATLSVDRSNEKLVGVAAHLLSKASEPYRSRRTIMRQHRADILREFPTNTDLSMNRMIVAGERLLTPTELVEHYANRTGDDPRELTGFYFMLCGLANHPSASAFELYEDTRSVGFRQEHSPEFMGRVVSAITAPYLSAAQAFGFYCGWDCTRVEDLIEMWDVMFPDRAASGEVST